jgi:hypothetical protein
MYWNKYWGQAPTQHRLGPDPSEKGMQMGKKGYLNGLAVLIFCFFTLFFAALPLSAGKEVFTTSYECFDLEGNLRWQAVTEIFISPEQGIGRNMLVEKGKGVYGSFKEEVLWQSELEYTGKDGKICPIRSRTETFNTSKELICIESQEFDYGSGIATFKRDDKKSGKEYTKVFKIEGDIVNRLMLALYIQQFLRSGKQEAILYILSNEPNLIKCRLYIVGEEEIEVGGIKMQAYKLCLDPQLGLLNFVKVFIPKAYVWHSSSPDYQWFQYKGLEVSPSSPIVEIKQSKDKI